MYPDRMLHFTQHWYGIAAAATWISPQN